MQTYLENGVRRCRRLEANLIDNEFSPAARNFENVACFTFVCLYEENYPLKRAK